MGIPLLSLPLPPDIPSATNADLDALGAAADALGAAAELQLGNPAARYSHADWAREEQAEPACHAAMHYIILGRPPSLPADVLSCFPSHQCSSFSEIQQLAAEGRLHVTDDGIVLLVRQPTPQPPSDSQRPVGRLACLFNDEPVRVYVPLAHAPLGHTDLPLDSILLPRHHAYSANARTFLLVDWYVHLYPVVASPLPEVSSTENFTADGPLAHHLDAPARRAWHCR